MEERFLCICCQEIAFKPVTTTCFHNICLNCLQRSFRAGVYNCPHCRHELGKNLEMEPNEQLCKALNAIFPGYENGRWLFLLLIVRIDIVSIQCLKYIFISWSLKTDQAFFVYQHQITVAKTENFHFGW